MSIDVVNAVKVTFNLVVNGHNRPAKVTELRTVGLSFCLPYNVTLVSIFKDQSFAEL